MLTAKPRGICETTYAGRIWTRPNIATYLSCKIQAKVLGGDNTWLPRYMGFIYGPTSPITPMPNPSATRAHTMATLAADILSIAGNMIISPVTGIAYSDAGDAYSDNVLNLTARTDISSVRYFPSAGGYAADAPTPGSDNYYQVALLSKQIVNGVTTYYPYAVIQLADGTDGVAVLTGYELSHVWKLNFSFSE